MFRFLKLMEAELRLHKLDIASRITNYKGNP